ncbi:hypothetical protein, partial [Psychrobacillus soli]|uniref:hypothetical protein n=1 Tax=Psychrobacillus soli TaxID=1543965 RepID=UPI001C8DBB22
VKAHRSPGGKRTTAMKILAVTSRRTTSQYLYIAQTTLHHAYIKNRYTSKNEVYLFFIYCETLTKS